MRATSPRLHAAALAALLLPAAGCGHASAPPSAATVAGCYVFRYAVPQGHPLGWDLPDTLSFTTEVVRLADGSPYELAPYRLVSLSRRSSIPWDTLLAQSNTFRGPPPPPDALPLDSSRFPPDWAGTYVVHGWRFAPPDSVRVTLHVNMGPSWELHLRVSGDSLMGAAEPYSDVVPLVPPLYPIVGRRTPCRTPSRGAT